MLKLHLKILFLLCALPVSVFVNANETESATVFTEMPNYQTLKAQQKQPSITKSDDVPIFFHKEARESNKAQTVAIISACLNRFWNIDPSKDFKKITVEFELDRNVKLKSPIELISSENGPAQIIKDSFENAKRTIGKCLHYGGLNFPQDRFDDWQRIQVTFDPP